MVEKLARGHPGALLTCLSVTFGCSATLHGPDLDDDFAEDDSLSDAPMDDACGGGDPSTMRMVVSAPIGTGIQHLGRPINDRFEPMVGEEGVSLFPAAETFNTPLYTMEHKSFVIENQRSFDAHASVWGVSGSGGSDSSMRYASFRAQQLESVFEIDDATAMREPPPGAAYYVSRVFVGHSYEAVFSGSSNSFHAGVSGSFLVASGSMDVFAERHRLTTTAFGRGLEPNNGNALFARSADEIERAYSTSGEPVPVLVEYRRIPGTCLAETEKIHFVEPTEVRVNFDSIWIYNDGSPGQDTWSLSARCSLNGEDLWLDNEAIWDFKKNISDDCTSGIPGPGGDGNYCSYDLYWSANLELVPGDELECGIEGMAWDNQDPVDYAEFRYAVQDQNEPVSGRIGNFNSDTEYWLNYSLEFVDPVREPAEQH